MGVGTIFPNMFASPCHAYITFLHETWGQGRAHMYMFGNAFTFQIACFCCSPAWFEFKTFKFKYGVCIHIVYIFF